MTPPLMNRETERKILFWLGLILCFFGFLYLIRSILLPFVMGIGIAYFLDPAADKLQKMGLGRGSATALITITFFSVFTLLLVLLAPMLAAQISGLAAVFPHYYETLTQFVQQWIAKLPVDLTGNPSDKLKEFSGSLMTAVQNLVFSVLQSGMVVVNLLSLMVITPVVAFYLLRDWDVMTSRIDALLPRKHAAIIREQLSEIDHTIAGFVRGQFNVMLILGGYYALGLTLVGLPFGALIGLLAGLLIIIPYIGAFIGTALALSIAFAQFTEMWDIAAVGAVFVIGQIMESYYLTPNLVGSKVGLHPVWIIFGMLAGGSLFGFVGILLAVPVTAVIGVLVRFATQQYLRSELYESK
jgi:predicted PurR-regulated permease PerM